MVKLIGKHYFRNLFSKFLDKFEMNVIMVEIETKDCVANNLDTLAYELNKKNLIFNWTVEMSAGLFSAGNKVGGKWSNVNVKQYGRFYFNSFEKYMLFRLMYSSINYKITIRQIKYNYLNLEVEKWL